MIHIDIGIEYGEVQKREKRWNEAMGFGRPDRVPVLHYLGARFWLPLLGLERGFRSYLEDPRAALGGRERVHALVRKDLDQDFPPAVTDFLTRMYLPIEELEVLMDEATQSSYQAAVENYIEAHPARIAYWVDGSLE